MIQTFGTKKVFCTCYCWCCSLEEIWILFVLQVYRLLSSEALALSPFNVLLIGGPYKPWGPDRWPCFCLHPVVIKEVFPIYFGWVTTTWCAGVIMKSMHHVHHGVPVSGCKVKSLGENTWMIKRRIKLKGVIHSSPNSIVIEEKSWFFHHFDIRRGIKVKVDFLRYFPFDRIFTY